MHGQHPLIPNNIFRIMKLINNPTNEIKKINQIRPSQQIFTCQINSVFEQCMRHPQENTATHPKKLQQSSRLDKGNQKYHQSMKCDFVN